MRRRSTFGFTLLELLVALAVFGILSAMSYGGLNSVMRARQGVDRQAELLAQLQKAFTIIGKDLEQVVARSVRDSYGEEKVAMQAVDYEQNQLEFTRTGWNNPFPSKKRVRSMLQRVAYGLKEGRLLRIYWFDLDLSYDSPAFETVLLEQVAAFELRFVDGDREWQREWPVLGSDGKVLPRAVEVTIEIERLGRISRLFRIPAQSV